MPASVTMLNQQFDAVTFLHAARVIHGPSNKCVGVHGGNLIESFFPRHGKAGRGKRGTLEGAALSKSRQSNPLFFCIKAFESGRTPGDSRRREIWLGTAGRDPRGEDVQSQQKSPPNSAGIMNSVVTGPTPLSAIPPGAKPLSLSPDDSPHCPRSSGPSGIRYKKLCWSS